MDHELFSITLASYYYLLRGSIFFVLEMVLLSASASRNCSHFLARHVSTFNAIPRLFSPLLVAVYGVENSYREILPFAFLVAAAFYGFIGWMLWRRCKSAYWAALFELGVTVVGTILYLVVGNGLHWTQQHGAALLIGVMLNLLIFCVLAFDPSVRRAFNRQPQR